MGTFDKLDKNVWNSLSELYQRFNPYPLTKEELQRSKIIALEILNNFSLKDVDFGNEISLATSLNGAIDEFRQLGLVSVADQVFNVFNNIRFAYNDNPFENKFSVHSMMDETGAFICKKPYYLIVPCVIGADMIPFIVHEAAHLLKESNYLECRGIYTDLEVIPITLELITAYNNNNSNVFREREKLMYDVATLFRDLCKEKDSINIKDRASFTACYRQCVLYLNSFYYSLKLFNMYLDDSRFVLSLIDDVLSHRITTKEVIDKYLRFDDIHYNQGLEEFRLNL